MKKLILLVVLLASISISNADELVKFSLENRHSIGDAYLVDIMAEPVSGNWFIGNCSIVIEFNSDALSVLEYNNTEVLNRELIAQESGYYVTQHEYEDNKVSLGIVNINPIFSISGKERLATLRFSITNSNEFDNLKFFTDETEVFNNMQLLEYDISTPAGYKVVNPEAKEINGFTGIKTEINSELLQISPNPADNEISLNISETLGNNSEISVYNEAGAMVYTTKNVMSNNITINSKDFASGVYIIVLKNDNKIFQNKIIVKH